MQPFMTAMMSFVCRDLVKDQMKDQVKDLDQIQKIMILVYRQIHQVIMMHSMMIHNTVMTIMRYNTTAHIKKPKQPYRQCFPQR